MSNRKHSKPGEQPSKTPPTLPDTPSDDPLRVSSLKPTSSGFSQRRLLNVASVAVVVIALLALAIHWLPDALPRQPSAQPTRAAQTRNTPTPPIRGAGWKRSGPDWAQSIAFSSTAELGYACGASGAGNTPIFFAVYHVEQNSWSNPTRPASGADCRVVASPFSGSEMALIVDNCSGCATTSHVYRSHDDGRTWSQVRLPASFVALDLAWTTSRLFMTTVDTSTPIYNAHLLSVHDNGSYTEITAQQLIGYPAHMEDISLLSSGLTLVASVYLASCAENCALVAHTTDGGAGAQWDTATTIYKGSFVEPVAAQPGVNNWLGWANWPGSSTQMLLSRDNGLDWLALPPFPSYRTTCANAYMTPDGSMYVWCDAPTNVIYKLRSSADTWHAIAPISSGAAITVQYDASTGHAIAFWALANPTSSNGQPPGLEYYPL
ncbi:MAG TPA: hypothetical protein VFS83_16915 [Ktedonobacterales bacterium]|nr:hypothetical protein [Ktedonobacterales bacterium]